MSDSQFLKDPASWPVMSDMFTRYVCLRRGKETAFILSTALNELCLGNVFDGGTGEVIIFASVDGLIVDGWVVD